MRKVRVRVRVRNLVIATLLVLAASVAGFGQVSVTKTPDCTFGFNLTTAVSSNDYDNRQTACTTWLMVYNSTGFSALSIELDGAPDNGGQPGTYVSWPNVATGTTLPLTNIVNGVVTGYKYQPWVKVKVNSVTGTGSIRGTAIGFRPFSGQDAANVPQAFSTNGVPLSGQGGAATDGDTNNVSYPLDNGANARSLLVSPRIFNGATWDRQFYCPNTTPFSVASTTTQIVALVSGQKVRICSASLNPTTVTAGSVEINYGTGANCGTGTTTLTGLFTLPASAVVSIPIPITEIGPLVTPVAQAVCIHTTTSTVAGYISWGQW